MPVFNYEAIDKYGNMAQGRVEAENDMAAVARLRKMDYSVLDLTVVKESPFARLTQGRGSIKTKDVLFFVVQLATMISAGMPLARSLQTLKRQSENPAMGKVIEEIASNVESGMSFSESLRSFPDVFPAMQIDMVAAGETGGVLEEMLHRIAEQLRRDKRLKDSLRSAAMYPIVMVCIALVVVLVMLFYLVPTFEGMFPKNIPVPAATQVVFAASHSVREYWYVYLIGGVSVFFALRTYFTGTDHKLWDHYKFSLPLFGPLLKKAAIARFTSTLATLLASGVPVIQALEAAGPSTGSGLAAEKIKTACERVQEGQGIAGPLQESLFFPPMVIDMVAVGEETGNITHMLTQAAEFYDEEVQTMSKGLTALLEPFMIVIIGLIVGGIIIALYLPMFAITTSLS
ncbi:type II secretion system F family protein [Heliophilum fasciatum]|uniref:Type IV pilus assembly protein PilC n=1 Tax=Heliophilum fasciatum TaxID=35700 RepID=A0A4R2RU45_9FIRM|nr:type II secretion system F family protein [Heliophilum fasciatum]MCW2278643.1 type IV pilus assembly protein PilC [Heliophilum fasciatum]TCP62655.1 type IV pilus assembly protein PilC [Heliophilum fasciatum]